MSEVELTAPAEARLPRARPARVRQGRGAGAAGLLHESGRYLAASVLALGVDYGLLVALTELARLHYLVSSIVSYSLGVAVHYGLCIRFVFRDRPVTDRRAEFAGFFAVGLLGLAVTQAVLWFCVSRLVLDYRAAKVVATAISFILNFVVRKILLFTQPATAR